MVSFQNVAVGFQNGKKELWAVKDADFTIKKGEIFGIVGSSGAGKSTLLRTITLLQKPTTGRLFIEGVEVTDANG